MLSVTVANILYCSAFLIKSAVKDPSKAKTFALAANADFYAFNIQSDDSGTSFNVKHKDNVFTFRIAMRGDHNVENALAAIAVGFKYNISYDVICKALEKTAVPGRGRGIRKFSWEYQSYS